MQASTYMHNVTSPAIYKLLSSYDNYDSYEYIISMD